MSHDIPLSLAQAAHNGTSFVPERRAVQVQNEYDAHLSDVLAAFTKAATKGGTLSLVPSEMESYRAGYLKRFTAYLHSRTRIVSTMIAGGSNFPARMMNKRNEVSGRRVQELLAYQASAFQRAIHRLRPDLRPIMAGDANALDRLAEKLAKLEAHRDRCKAINAAIREFKKEGEAAQINALLLLGLKPSTAKAALEPDFCGRLGIPAYELTNTGAEIRRIRERMEHLAAQAEKPVVEAEGENGVTLEENPGENRVRLTFPGKPSEGDRKKLKAAGFRWTPSLGVWQAYHNTRNVETAKSFLA